MHTITQLLLTVLVAICTAASLTDEDIAKILDESSRGDALASLGQYDTNLQIDNLRDKLRTLEGLGPEPSDIFPAENPDLLGEAVHEAKTFSASTRINQKFSQTTGPSTDTLVDSPASINNNNDGENIYSNMCRLFCSQREMTFITMEQLHMCRKLKCFNDRRRLSTGYNTKHSEGQFQNVGNSKTKWPALRSSELLVNEHRLDENLQLLGSSGASGNSMYTDDTYFKEKVVRDLVESDRMLRRLSDLVYRGCLCTPCNSKCTKK